MTYSDGEEYSEYMKGVIIDTKSGHAPLKVLVEDPFHSQISVEGDKIFWNQYINYNFHRHWRGFHENHPENGNLRDFYCNYKDGKFYMLSDSTDSAWQEVELESTIIRELRSAWLFRSHIDGIFHAGQPCSFKGYAIDKNNRFHRPSTIDKDFEKFDWKYDPFTFSVSRLNENTIDNLVEEIPISKDMTKKMVRYHQEQDEAKQQEEKDNKKKNTKEKWKARLSKINDHFGKYEKFYRYGVLGVFLLFLTALFQIVRIIFMSP